MNSLATSDATTAVAKGTARTAVHPDPIVCVSDLFWEEHWSSEQQLMTRLSKRCRVLYVERPVSLFSLFTGSSDGSVLQQWWRSLRGSIRQQSSSLTILTPPPVLPFRYVGFVNRFNEWLRRRTIRRALRRMKATKPALWIYAPDSGRIVGELGEAFSLYFCADDWSASQQWWNRSSDIRKREGELASKVDLIVGTSRKIATKWQQSHGKALFVSNGADVASFKRAREADLAIPADLEAIPHPRVGYIGFVDVRFDTKMYEALARSRPDWHFVVVGPLMEKLVNLSRLKRLPNLHFLGPRQREDLPAYLKGFDVCTIPYICDTWSESIFPLKLFEYLGAGRPVVATALPELLPFQQNVFVASGKEEFEKAIETSLESPLPQVSEEFLAENSWDAKADLLWSTILQKLPDARAGN